VIELRRVVDRAEEARQVVEERVVAAAEVPLDGVPVRRVLLMGVTFSPSNTSFNEAGSFRRIESTTTARAYAGLVL